MGYPAVWKVLEEMIVDFRKKGVQVPAKVIDDLKNARTTIRILKADPSRAENIQRIEEYLTNVESYAASEGQERFGQEYVREWFKRVGEAGKETEKEEETKFIPELPRGHEWIRVLPSPDLPVASLEMLADESKLSHELQKDGCLLVYGKDKDVKDFVKKMATKHGSKARK